MRFWWFKNKIFECSVTRGKYKVFAIKNYKIIFLLYFAGIVDHRNKPYNLSPI